MIIKVVFDSENDIDYVYCPEEIAISKSDIRQNFYSWIDHTDEEHPFWIYEDGIRGLCYRGDAIVYWINKYILKNKNSSDQARVLESFSSNHLKYDLKIRL